MALFVVKRDLPGITPEAGETACATTASCDPPRVVTYSKQIS